MSSGAQQLKEDFKQVQKLLEIYPDIKITDTKGDPPEQYDIEYTIKGYRISPEGTPIPDNNHEVRITLPFGYPHFPPTVKPITPIFHPDIDPDAIRIADFWQEKHSLSELIVHIGQMICGNHYSKDEPFNQNAFEWFEERNSWLPFDILEPRDEDDTEQGETRTPPAKTEKQQSFAPATDLDILKDDINFPFDDDEDFGGPGDEFSFDLEELGGEDDTGKGEITTPPANAETQQSFAPAADLDILKDVIDFPFDDEESGDPEDEFSFDLEKDAVIDDLIELEEIESTSETTSDHEAKKSAEAVDLQESQDIETEDLFSLDMEDIEDDISFDLTGETDKTESLDDSLLPDGLFDLDTETTDEKSGGETTLTFDSADITSAFEKEVTPSDKAPDDLADLDEDAFDFSFADESSDIGGGSTADLSGLEDDTTEETNKEADFEPDWSSEDSGDEEKILSALSLNEEFAAPEKPGEKSEAIQSLIEQKQIFSAKKILTKLSDHDSLTNRKELERTIAEAISEAEDLYKKADNHEQKGEFEKAGILLDLVANIAIDFPGLDFARNRIRESMMKDGKKKPDAHSEQTRDEKADASAKIPDTQRKRAGGKLRPKVPVRLVVTLLVVIILGGISAGIAYIFNNDSESIHLAQDSFQKAAQLVDDKEFKAAQNELEIASAALNTILFFQDTEKEAIISKMNNLSNSSLFKEGLKGRVLYGEQYVSVETARAIDKFNTQKSFAEQFLKSNKLEQAILAYEQSLPYAEKTGFEGQVKDISRKIGELRLELQLSQAKQFDEEKNWLSAEKAYQNAQELSKSISTPEVQNDIANRLATVSSNYNLQEGLKALNDSQWQKSIDAFQKVQKILTENPQVKSETNPAEIDKLLVQSQLYYGLSLAKKAYENKEWIQAIDAYNDAIILMETNTALLGQEATGNIEKITKTILTTHVAREQAKVAAATAENDLDTTAQHYDTIITLIEKSAFKDDEMLHKILEDARTKAAEIKKQLLISKKEKWLEDNYEDIFRENYPSAKQSELLNPEVRFIKREKNIMIFTMSCSERKQGRTFRLELNYQHDMDKDAWSLFSGRIEE